MNKTIKNKFIQIVKPILKAKPVQALILSWHSIVNENIIGSYSQKGEDLIIEKLLGNKTKGFYVDIGANHPISCSNTARFYKKEWRGINIEPNPQNIKLFKTERPLDTNLGIGVANKKGKLTFYEFEENMLSTFSKTEAQNNIKQGKILVKKYNVSVEKLSNILDKYAKSKIDLISIDTEGYDMEVLKSNNWKKYQPRVICLETASRGYGSDYSDDFEKYLSKFGYKKAAQTRLNSIYLREF